MVKWDLGGRTTSVVELWASKRGVFVFKYLCKTADGPSFLYVCKLLEKMLKYGQESHLALIYRLINLTQFVLKCLLVITCENNTIIIVIICENNRRFCQSHNALLSLPAGVCGRHVRGADQAIPEPSGPSAERRVLRPPVQQRATLPRQQPM